MRLITDKPVITRTRDTFEYQLLQLSTLSRNHHHTSKGPLNQTLKNETHPSKQKMPPPHPPPLPLTLIVATTPIRPEIPNPTRTRLGIGLRGTLPWPRIKTDMTFFARVTSRPPRPGATNAVIMGRKTYESVPKSLRPLKSRINVVVTRDTSGVVREGVLKELESRRGKLRETGRVRAAEGEGGEKKGGGLENTESSNEEPVTDAIVTSSLDQALEELDSRYGSSGALEQVFVIGGAEIYGAALRMGVKSEDGLGLVKRPVRIVMTNVLRKAEDGDGGERSFECDTFFPEEDLTPANGWRSVGAEEVSEWVGEEVTGDWMEEGDVKVQMVGFERV